MMKTIVTSNQNPWADIPTAPTGQFSRLRVYVETRNVLFWVRDEANRPGLLIEISKNISIASLIEARINIRDIKVDVQNVGDGTMKALVIMLENNQNQDVFVKLCFDLIEHTLTSANHELTFLIICNRLKKWQSLLSGKNANLLSANEVQGLYAELCFISEILAKDKIKESIIVKGWEGPERTKQDFILGNAAVEIKSIGGKQRGKVRISSEDQLDTHLDKLYLRVYFLSEPLGVNSGESLNAIVRRISDQLANRDCKDLFETKLETAHYIDIPDYDAPLFRVQDCRTYFVREGFPRVTRSTLPDGIESVSYDLVLARIENFRTNTMDILGNNYV